MKKARRGRPGFQHNFVRLRYFARVTVQVNEIFDEIFDITFPRMLIEKEQQTGLLALMMRLMPINAFFKIAS
jgi:hypothetical protein